MKQEFKLRDWCVYEYYGEYKIRGLVDYVPEYGRYVKLNISLKEFAHNITDDVLVCETEENRYVCPLKYFDIRYNYNYIDGAYVKKLKDKMKKSGSEMDALALATAELVLDKHKSTYTKHILKLAEEGRKELELEDSAFRQNLIDQAKEYDNSIYIAWYNVDDTNMLAYHLGDELGIVTPELHVGTIQDSVLYTKYPDKQDDVKLDFRYFPRGFSTYTTYLWSENITHAVIKNCMEWNITFNGRVIAPGEVVVIPREDGRLYL